jgi:hypothetical protein
LIKDHLCDMITKITILLSNKRVNYQLILNSYHIGNILPNLASHWKFKSTKSVKYPHFSAIFRRLQSANSSMLRGRSFENHSFEFLSKTLRIFERMVFERTTYPDASTTKIQSFNLFINKWSFYKWPSYNLQMTFFIFRTRAIRRPFWARASSSRNFTSNKKSKTNDVFSSRSVVN